MKVAATVGKGIVEASAITTQILVGAIALVAPLLAFATAGIGILVIYNLVRRLRPRPAARGFRVGQIPSGGMLALAHGTNDAQKTMGVITLALVAHGDISASNFQVPLWVVVAAATAIAQAPTPGAGGSSRR